jgi:hypothetical protein
MPWPADAVAHAVASLGGFPELAGNDGRRRAFDDHLL